MENNSWPPTITRQAPPVQDRKLNKAQRKGHASLWLAGVGLFMGLGMLDFSGILDRYTISQPPQPYFAFAWVGMVCNALGLLLGILGRKAITGRIGACLSLLAAGFMVYVVLAGHAHNGNWPWLSDDDCNCP